MMTILDEHGLPLTDVVLGHGRRPCELTIASAARPAALFTYFLYRNGRTITLRAANMRLSARLETRWAGDCRVWYVLTDAEVDPRRLGAAATEPAPRPAARRRARPPHAANRTRRGRGVLASADVRSEPT
jgi:hypothetical protein